MTAITYRGKFFYILVGGAKGGESQLLGELREGGVGQHGHVTQQLVDAVPAHAQESETITRARQSEATPTK